MDKWNFGGGTAGAMTGFLLAGPIGALVGGVAGAAAGGEAGNLMLPKTAATLILMGSDQSISCPKGGVLGIVTPAGLTAGVVSLSPATGSAVGHLEVLRKKGFAAATASGDINVLWRAPDGTAQATVVHLTVV